MATDSEEDRIIYLSNTGNEDINDISFNISPNIEQYVSISPDSISTLAADSSKQIILTINSGGNDGIISGLITAYSENISSSLDLVINSTKDFVPENNTTTETNTIVTTCSDLNGIICSSDQECTGDSLMAKDGTCCMASCEIPQKSSTGKWIGWGLLVVVLLLVFWFYKKKYKKVTPKKPF